MIESNIWLKQEIVVAGFDTGATAFLEVDDKRTAVKTPAPKVYVCMNNKASSFKND